MYDNVERKYIPAMITRVIMGNVTYTIITISIQQLPLTVVNIVANTQPLMTALLGCLILGEKIRFAQVCCLLLAFTGIFIFFSDAANKKASGKTNIDIKYFLVLLILPISVAL